MTKRDELNWIETGGQFGWKRRFPTFVVKRSDSGKFYAEDETDNMKVRCSSPTIEGIERMLRPYCNYRTDLSG